MEYFVLLADRYWSSKSNIMFVITATELKKLIGHTIAKADNEPVIITKSNKPRVVMLSIHEYNRLITNQKDYVEPVVEVSESEIDNNSVSNPLPNPLVYNDKKIKEIEKLTLEELLRYGTAWKD